MSHNMPPERSAARIRSPPLTGSVGPPRKEFLCLLNEDLVARSKCKCVLFICLNCPQLTDQSNAMSHAICPNLG